MNHYSSWCSLGNILVFSVNRCVNQSKMHSKSKTDADVLPLILRGGKTQMTVLLKPAAGRTFYFRTWFKKKYKKKRYEGKQTKLLPKI